MYSPRDHNEPGSEIVRNEPRERCATARLVKKRVPATREAALNDFLLGTLSGYDAAAGPAKGAARGAKLSSAACVAKSITNDRTASCSGCCPKQGAGQCATAGVDLGCVFLAFGQVSLKFNDVDPLHVDDRPVVKATVGYCIYAVRSTCRDGHY